MPAVRPPEGTVAASSATGSEVPRVGSDPEVEAAGLLRVLESGPDVQRQAAAKALSLPFASTCNPRVAAALAALVGDEARTNSLRAESWAALRAVMGEELSWDDEVRIRHSFPEGVDWDWLESVLASSS